MTLRLALLASSALLLLPLGAWAQGAQPGLGPVPAAAPGGPPASVNDYRLVSGAAGTIQTTFEIGDSEIAHHNVWPGASPGSVVANTWATQDLSWPQQVYRVTGTMYVPLSQNFGYSGDTTGYLSPSQPGILPRLQAILAGNGPGAHANSWILEGGTNDLTNGIPPATTISNLQTAGVAILNSGALLIFHPIMPRGAYGGLTVPQSIVAEMQRRQINRANETWCRAQARCIWMALDEVLGGNDAANVTFSSASGNTYTITGGSATPNEYVGWTLYVPNITALGARQLISASTATTITLAASLATSTAPMVFVSGANGVITRTDGGSFLSDGHVAGERFTISGTTTNDGSGSVTAVTASTITTNRTTAAQTVTGTFAAIPPGASSNLILARNGIPKDNYMVSDMLHVALLATEAIADQRYIPNLVGRLTPAPLPCQGLTDAYDPTNNPYGAISTNCTFLGTGGTLAAGTTGTLASGWGSALGGSNTSTGTAAYSITCGGTIPGGGCAQQMAISRNAATGGVGETYAASQTIPAANYSAGDLIYGECLINVTSGYANVDKVYLNISFPDDSIGTQGIAWDGYNQYFDLGTSQYGLYQTSRAGAWLRYRTPTVALGNVGTGLAVKLTAGVVLNASAATAATITVQFGQCVAKKAPPGTPT